MSVLDKLLSLLGFKTITDSLIMLRRPPPIEVRVEYKEELSEETEDLLDFLSKSSKGNIRIITVKGEAVESLPLPVISISGSLKERFMYYGQLTEGLLPILLEALLISSGKASPNCSNLEEYMNKLSGLVRLYVVTGIPCIIAGVQAVNLLACSKNLRLEIVNIEGAKKLAKKIKSVPAFEVHGKIVLQGAPSGVGELAKKLMEAGLK